MKLQGLYISTLLLFGLGTPGQAISDILAFADENGMVSLSNVTTDNRFSLIVKTPEDNSQASRPLTTYVSHSNSSKPYSRIVEKAARANQLDEALLHAVIATESSYNPQAVSNKGASGLMQLMPQTAKRYGVTNRFDPSENILGGARYLKDLLQLFNNDLPLALAAYNSGEGAVVRHGNKIPPYPQTIVYVNKVMELYGRYRISER